MMIGAIGTSSWLTKLVSWSGFGYQSELELRVAEAARRQYNKLKMQTKAEIRQTIDQLLVGEFIVSKVLCTGGGHMIFSS